MRFRIRCLWHRVRYYRTKRRSVIWRMAHAPNAPTYDDLERATMQWPATDDRSWIADAIPLQSEVTNYQLQAQVADELNNALRERMLADGYVEIAPGSWMRP